MRTKLSFPLRISPAFTLLEFVVVLAIMSVLFGIAYSGGGRGRELRLGDKAQMEIVAIFSAEKSHKRSTGAYFMARDTSEINTGLSMDIHNPSFDFRVLQTIEGFRIEGVRLDGNFCKGKIISLESTGGAIKKDCPEWGKD